MEGSCSNTGGENIGVVGDEDEIFVFCRGGDGGWRGHLWGVVMKGYEGIGYDLRDGDDAMMFGV